MADQRTFRLRVSYRKSGRLVMLSHLEIARALERLIRRAGLPFAVSCGFSPHMRIAFGSALPVGVGSTCEFFDIVLTDYVAPAKALGALQEASAEGLSPTSCAYVEDKAAAASVACPVSTYAVRLTEEPVRIVYPEKIEVVRKKKTKTLVVEEFLVGEVKVANADDVGGTAACADDECAVDVSEADICADDVRAVGACRIEFSLIAKPTGSLRPDVFARAMLEEMKRCDLIAEDASILSITRTAQSA